MVRQIGSYSWFVAAAKIILPLLALVFLSTLFLFSKQIDPSNAIPYAKVDVEKIASEQSLSKPKFSGVLEGDGTFELVAEVARPDTADPNLIFVESVLATLEQKPGDSISLRSGLASLHQAQRYLEFNNDVQLDTSDGFRMRTENAHVDLEKQSINSPGEISVAGNSVSITAGSMQARFGDASRNMVFAGGVKVIYTPSKQR